MAMMSLETSKTPPVAPAESATLLPPPPPPPAESATLLPPPERATLLPPPQDCHRHLLSQDRRTEEASAASYLRYRAASSSGNPHLERVSSSSDQPRDLEQGEAESSLYSYDDDSEDSPESIREADEADRQHDNLEHNDQVCNEIARALGWTEPPVRTRSSTAEEVLEDSAVMLEQTLVILMGVGHPKLSEPSGFETAMLNLRRDRPNLLERVVELASLCRQVAGNLWIIKEDEGGGSSNPPDET